MLFQTKGWIKKCKWQLRSKGAENSKKWIHTPRAHFANADTALVQQCPSAAQRSPKHLKKHQNRPVVMLL
jgi:hypothetical protein